MDLTSLTWGTITCMIGVMRGLSMPWPCLRRLESRLEGLERARKRLGALFMSLAPDAALNMPFYALRARITRLRPKMGILGALRTINAFQGCLPKPKGMLT